jgi:transposase InsO family protein
MDRLPLHLRATERTAVIALTSAATSALVAWKARRGDDGTAGKSFRVLGADGVRAVHRRNGWRKSQRPVVVRRLQTITNNDLNASAKKIIDGQLVNNVIA